MRMASQRSRIPCLEALLKAEAAQAASVVQFRWHGSPQFARLPRPAFGWKQAAAHRIRTLVDGWLDHQTSYAIPIH